MTECERIVREGIVSEEFLKEETRCDFFVDSTRKKIWAIQLDLARELTRVCNEINVKFFLHAGSLLGAVRHHGFIPWDDDFDVAMLREDYEKLLKHNTLFEHPYFLQTPHTDPNYAFSFARIVNDKTTYCSEMFSYQGYHAGVCIDIFPVDPWIRSKGEAVYNEVAQLNRENSTFMRMKNPNLDEDNQKRVAAWAKKDPVAVYDRIQALASQFLKEDADSLADGVVTVWKYGKDIYPANSFDKQVYVPFEGMELPISSRSHEILRALYGDYMIYPPLKKRGVWHSGVIINPDLPYSQVLKQRIEEGNQTMTRRYLA